MNIFDLVTAREIATYYSNNPSNDIMPLGETLFPSRKGLGLDLSWIKGSKGLPVALMPSAFDVKATIRDRIGFDKVQTEMPFFKESMTINEKERQELNKAVNSLNSEMYTPVLQKIYDDISNLVEGADVQTERMRMQLLSTGKISISANGVAYDYNYKMKADHMETLLTTSKWSDLANSDPIEDIIEWSDKIEEDEGERPTRAICSRKTFKYIMGNEKIKAAILRTKSILGVTESIIKSYVEEMTGVKIAIYSKKYALSDGSVHAYFPDNVFTLIPDGNLGNTWYGTTPEESDLMTGGTDAQVEIVNTGVAVTTTKQTDPVNVNTKVSMIALPSFESIDKIFIGTVA